MVDMALAFLARAGREIPRPDVALIDLNLPRTEGGELIRRFREHPYCGGVPLIVTSSSDSPIDRARAAQLGADEYFRKPSDLAEFMTLGGLIRSVLVRRLPVAN